MSSGIDYVRINAIGATVVSVLTIIGGTYLLVALLRQGRGKLRVRLLLGLVFSDIALGLIVLPPEVLYVAGRPMITGTSGCDALGFLLTMALFTQHMWTLLMAVATFLLLKYPLSRTTTFMEKYSWACFPIILGVSALHSGLWYRYYGFMSLGNLCYYNGDPADVIPDARDLIQFIPRAVTFGTVAILYSMLYRFLRRPDTINIASEHSGSTASRHKEGGIMRMAKRIQRKEEKEDDRPPWERMEFVQVGHRRWEDQSQGGIPPDEPLPMVSRRGTIEPPDLAESRADLPSLVRQSSGSSRETGRNWEHQRGSDAETLVTPTMTASQVPQALSPVFSEGKARFDDVDMEEDDEEGQHGREGTGETMGEFFQEYQVSTDNGQAERGGKQISAAAYFNRQASLLMLYFPLAYVVVFSASLVRLIYDMTTNGAPNPILSIISAWFTLSVGILDAIVYGLAEFIVKRKVRRKMPDRI